MENPLLNLVHSKQLLIEVSIADREKAWPSEAEYFNDVDRWIAYKNRLSLNKISEYLGISEKKKQLPILENLSSKSEMVNGTALQLGEIKLVIIPSETRNHDKFCVDEKWIDNDKGVGYHYLAVQLILSDEEDEGYVLAWGYTTQQELKEGTYDKFTETYSIKREVMNKNVKELLIASVQKVSDKLIALKNPAPVKEKDAKKVLRELGSHFNDYIAKLAEYAEKPVFQEVLKLRDWLIPAQNNDMAINFWEAQPVGFRNGRPAHFTEDDAIATLIDHLNTKEDEVIRRLILSTLGEIGTDKLKVIDAITRVLDDNRDLNTEWEAAICLAQLAPNHPKAATIKTYRAMELEYHKLALSVVIMPKNETINALISLKSPEEKTCLPPGLKLTVLDNTTDEIISEIEAQVNDKGEGKDNMILIPLEEINPGDNIRVKVQFNQPSIQEDVNF